MRRLVLSTQLPATSSRLCWLAGRENPRRTHMCLAVHNVDYCLTVHAHTIGQYSSFTIKGNGFEIIQDIEYDAVHDKLYYGGTIPLQVSDTSGGNLQTLLSSLDSGYVKYIRVDPVRGRLYWLTAARQYMTAGLNVRGRRVGGVAWVTAASPACALPG